MSILIILTILNIIHWSSFVIIKFQTKRSCRWKTTFTHNYAAESTLDGAEIKTFQLCTKIRENVSYLDHGITYIGIFTQPVKHVENTWKRQRNHKNWLIRRKLTHYATGVNSTDKRSRCKVGKIAHLVCSLAYCTTYTRQCWPA